MLRNFPRHFLFLCGLILAGTYTVFLQDRPSVFQSWNEVQLIVPVERSTDAAGKSVDKITAIFNGIGRFGRKDDVTDARAGAELNFRANKHLTFVTSALARGDEVVENHRHYET